MGKVRVHLRSLVGIFPGENGQQLNQCGRIRPRLCNCSETVAIQHPNFHVRRNLRRALPPHPRASLHPAAGFLCPKSPSIPRSSTEISVWRTWVRTRGMPMEAHPWHRQRGQEEAVKEREAGISGAASDALSRFCHVMQQK